MKKLLWGLLSFALVFIGLSDMPNLQADAATSGSYTYTVADGKATITSVNKINLTGDVVIPSTLGGYPVVAIGDYAFKECSFASVTIPNGVTSIGDRAFWGCDGLTSITIPNSVTSIDMMRFLFAQALKAYI